jgi:hypothetical protein
MIGKCTRLVALVASTLAAALPHFATAQTYPEKPI